MKKFLFLISILLTACVEDDATLQKELVRKCSAIGGFVMPTKTTVWTWNKTYAYYINLDKYICVKIVPYSEVFNAVEKPIPADSTHWHFEFLDINSIFH